MTGPMNFGHHAMLKFPDEAGSGVISTSRFVLGQVFVKPTELPENRGYSILKPGAEFDSLSRVPTIIVSPFARRGYVDHTQYDTGSIQRLINRRFGLAPLPGIEQRDAALRKNGEKPMGDLTAALELPK